MIKVFLSFMVSLCVTISIIMAWIITMLFNLLWSNQFKRTTAFFISEFMSVWNIKVDNLYTKGFKMNCASTKHINDFLDNQDKDTKENEKYELEFLEILSNLKIYAMKIDKLELLKQIIKEEFNL